MIKSFVATAIELSITAMIESLEKGGSFNQRDREKFAQTAHAKLQKSIDENLKALKSIRHDILMRDLLRDLPHMSSLWRFAFDHVFKVQEILNNKK